MITENKEKWFIRKNFVGYIFMIGILWFLFGMGYYFINIPIELRNGIMMGVSKFQSQMDGKINTQNHKIEQMSQEFTQLKQDYILLSKSNKK